MKNSQLLFDLKAWLLALLLIPLGVHADDLQTRILISIGFWAVLIAGFYPHQWLIRRFARRRQWVAYAAGVALLLAGLTLLTKTSFEWLGEKGTPDYAEMALTMAILLFLSTAISFAYKVVWLQVKYEKALRRQLEAELKLLQSQVNPHFLFNTLNNIYAQNLSNPAAANDMILQLADLMRYQTESSRKNQVKLEEEVLFLKNYIALESSRLPPNTEMTFSPEMPEDASLLLPPMLFVPFVENAFKHGIGTDPGCFIRIRLWVQDKNIIFELENSIPKRKRSMPSTQTGLSNVQKRLEILYPDQHELHIETNGDTYHTRLSIPAIRK